VRPNVYDNKNIVRFIL